MTYRKIGALIIRDGRMLLITATADPEVYTTPGGPQEDGVPHHRTLATELRAELGVEIRKPVELFGSYDITSNIDDTRVRSTVYRVEVDGEPDPRQPGRRLVWANPLTPVPMSTTVQAVMADAVDAGLITPGERP